MKPEDKKSKLYLYKNWKNIYFHAYHAASRQMLTLPHALGNRKFAAQHFLMAHMMDQYDQYAHGPPSQYHTSPNQYNGA